MDNRRTYKFFSAAIAAFNRAAVKPEFADFQRGMSELGMRECPAPFTLEEYDEDESRVIECPEHAHDCGREGCGVTYSTGGRRGVILRDAEGRTVLERGVITPASRGF